MVEVGNVIMAREPEVCGPDAGNEVEQYSEVPSLEQDDAISLASLKRRQPRMVYPSCDHHSVRAIIAIGVTMLQRMRRCLASVLCVGLLAITAALVWGFPAIAQTFPGLSLSEGSINSIHNIPTFTSGNLELAPVFLDGKFIGSIPSFITLVSDENGDRNSSLNAASRSYILHSKLQKILSNMTLYSREVLDNIGIVDLDARARELNVQLVTRVSEEGGTAFVWVTFPQTDVPELVYSVTPADIARPRFGGSQPVTIAEKVATLLEDALIQAWRERQIPHQLAQARRALSILVVLAGTSFMMGWGQRRITARQHKISESLSNLEAHSLQDNWTSGSTPVMRGIAQPLQRLSLRQRQSLNAFYKAVLFWGQWLIWLLGIGYVLSLFYWSRPFSNWIVGVSIRGFRAGSLEIGRGWPPTDWLFSFGQQATLGTPLFLLLLVLATRLALKGGDVLSEVLARRWVEQRSIQKRLTIRTRTVARALKGWLRAIVYLILGVTIVYQLNELGTISRAVAVFFGFLSFALSLASQDLLKDLIGGALVLWEDQYAVGDVICIQEQWGLVERISLRVTQLRNLDGELITIPNGSVGIVRNLSSDWSQVNYAVEVSYDADIDRVLAVIDEVANTLYRDPQWQEHILAAPEILGIEHIAHTGVLIRLIIKTQPLQQWPVAREFRLRLKRAFDAKGIEVGIPLQRWETRNPQSV